MAVGNAVLDIVLGEGFMESVARKGLLLKQGLAAIADDFPDVIEEIRGEGLLLGLRCKAPNSVVQKAFTEEKLLCAPAGDNVLRLLPPLTVTEDDIQEALNRIRKASEAVSAANQAAAS